MKKIITLIFISIINVPCFGQKQLKAEELNQYLRNSKEKEPYVSITNTSNDNLIDIVRAINCSANPVSIKLEKTELFTEIPDQLFLMGWQESNKKLKRISIPKEITRIGDFAFFYCENLVEVEFHGKEYKIKEIGEGAFSACINLIKIEIPTSISELKPSTFTDCISLPINIIPQNIKSIGSITFGNCKSVKNITILGNIKTLRTHSFMLCDSLEKVILPESLKEIERNAFFLCKSLKSIVINSNCNLNENIFNKKGETDKITIYVKPEYLHLYQEKYTQYNFEKIKE